MNEILEAADTLAGNARMLLALETREQEERDPPKEARARVLLRESVSEYEQLRRAAGQEEGDIREEMIASLRRYAEHYMPTGDFLRAVLENNLKEAFGCADIGNRYAMFAIVSYCYNQLPAACWGSPEKVVAWLAQRAAPAPADTPSTGQ